MPKIATPATNKRSRNISPYSIARSLQKESSKSAANAANNPISINYPKGFRGVMPIPSEPGTPSFEEINITKFLERYEKLGANFSLSKPEVIKRIPQYYKIIIK